jgi:hypothetical protein
VRTAEGRIRHLAATSRTLEDDCQASMNCWGLAGRVKGRRLPRRFCITSSYQHTYILAYIGIVNRGQNLRKPSRQRGFQQGFSLRKRTARVKMRETGTLERRKFSPRHSFVCIRNRQRTGGTGRRSGTTADYWRPLCGACTFTGTRRQAGLSGSMEPNHNPRPSGQNRGGAGVRPPVAVWC